MIARQIFYEGRVQGVGFRYTVRHLAKGYDVTGSVRNLADGRVELQVAGAADEVGAFLTAIRESELSGHIRKEVEHDIPPPVGVKGFKICF